MEVTGYSFSAGEVVIPAQIDGRPVTRIGECAFGFSGLTNIVLPDSLEEIGDEAFVNCYRLQRITIPRNVKKIGKEVFDACWDLTDITVDSRNEHYVAKAGTIYDKAMKKLVQYPAGKEGNAKISSSVIEILDGAFAGCKLDLINIPVSVEKIGAGAFSGCFNLEYVKIPMGVTVIGEQTFSGCGKLARVDIPGSVVSIADDAFSDVSKVELKVEKGSYAESYAKEHEVKYRYLGDSDCAYRQRADGTLEITGYTGYDAKITVPAEIEGKRVTKIADDAFVSYTDMIFGNKYSITLPVGITEIGNYAFCDSGLSSISFPKGLRKIGKFAFRGCPYISSIELPDSVTAIGRDAFNGCGRLKSVKILSNKIKIEDEVFLECNKDLMLLVGRGSTGEAFAKKNKLKYKYLDGSSPTCSHTYKTSITKAATGKNGSITKTCTNCGEKTITKVYAPKDIELSKERFTYNNKAHKPSVTIKNSKGKTLSSKKDFTVSYPKNIKNVGQYTITIKFKGNYRGTVKKTFTITPKGTSILKVTPKRKGVAVKWKKQTEQTSGYEIACSTDKRFSKKNTRIVLVGKNNITSKTVTKLKDKKKYYVRVRTYKTVKGKKYYSGWSKVKYATTRK